MVPITPQLSQFKSEFESARRWRRVRKEPLQFNDVRWDSLDRFLALGFPTVNDPDWRFTDVSRIAEKFFSLSAEPARDASHFRLAPFRLPENSGTELLFVNGYYMPSESKLRGLPTGVRVCPLSEMLDSHSSEIESYLARVAPLERLAFVALNTSLFMDGACVLIPEHAMLEDPIHLCFVSTGEADRQPAMSHPRVLVVLDEGSKATIVESYVGTRSVPYLTNAVTEIVLGENATLHHYRLQQESMEAYHISSTYLAAASGAKCSTHSVSLGGELSRNDFVAALRGERIQYGLNELYLIDRERLIDNHTTVQCDGCDCAVHQICNGMIADSATNVSDSKIMIAPDAHKTDVNKASRTFLFSKNARIQSSSQIENLANEINLTERAISRHIDEETASHVAAEGYGEARRRAIGRFIPEMLGQLTLPPFHSAVDRLLQQQVESVLGRLAAPDEVPDERNS